MLDLAKLFRNLNFEIFEIITLQVGLGKDIFFLERKRRFIICEMERQGYAKFAYYDNLYTIFLKLKI
jgi:hypothetical protein